MLQLTLAINRIASVAPLLAEQVMVAFGLLTPSKRSVRRNVCVATLLAEQGMVAVGLWNLVHLPSVRSSVLRK